MPQRIIPTTAATAVLAALALVLIAGSGPGETVTSTELCDTAHHPGASDSCEEWPGNPDLF
ncbi:hypothetical protein AB0I28_07175 [Phytomonospora sp. NPDC050363]|uniref:hypothetical protein n=1 Tax=Phytomonospora sp. NPDC050363 TaxID=3155642 RepID=UPI0033E16B63